MTLRLANATLTAGGLTNSGTIELAGGEYANPTALSVDTGVIVNAAGGSIVTVPGNGTFLEIVGRLDNQGTLTFSTDTVLRKFGPAVNTGTITLTAGTLTLLRWDDFSFDNSGAINVTGGTFEGVVTNNGDIEIHAGGAFSTDSLSMTNAGSLWVDAGGAFTGWLNNSGRLYGGGTITGGVSGNGEVIPFGSPLVMNGDISLGDFRVELYGPAAGTEYGQLRVNGAVTMTGQLVVALNYSALFGDPLVVVDNDGADPVVGTFTGLPEGGLFAAMNGEILRVSYVGGTGNDVTLTRVAPPGVVAWDGGPTGQGTAWLDPINWYGDVLPGPTDDVLIGQGLAGDPPEVILSADTAVHTASVSRTLRLTGGTLTIGAAQTKFIDLVIDGGLLAGNGATLTESSISGTGTFTNPAGFTLTLSATTVNLPTVNYGTLVGGIHSALNGGLTNAAGSTLRVLGDFDAYYPPYYSLSVVGGLTNSGTIDMFYANGGGAVLNVTGGPLTNMPGGTITDTSRPEALYGNDRINGTVDNQGTVTIGPGSWLVWSGSGTSTNSGTITAAGSLNLSALVNTGTISVPAGGGLYAGGFRYRSGSLTGDGRLILSSSTLEANFTPTMDNVQVRGSLDGPGTLTNPAGHTMVFNSITANTAVTNDGTLLIGSTVFNAALTNHGEIVGGGAINVAFTNPAGAAFRATHPLSVPQGFTNEGTFELAFGELSTSGVIVNAAGATFSVVAGGSWREFTGRLDNRGTVTVSDNLTWNNRGASTNSGSMTVAAGTVTVNQSVVGATFSTTGTVNVAAGAALKLLGTRPLTNLANGILGGGTFNVAGTFGVAGAAFTTVAADLTLDGPAAAVVNTLNNADALAGLSRIESGGRLTLLNGRNIVAPATAVFDNAGTLTVGGGSTLTAVNGVVNSGTLAGSGTVAAGVSGDGMVSPGGPSAGRLTVTGAYLGDGPVAVDLNGPADTMYDQLAVNGPVTLGNPLVLTVGYSANLNETFIVVDNDGTDPVTGTFTGVPNGSRVTVGGQQFRINYFGGTGNDVVLTRVAPAPPVVVSAVANDGSAQRSRVTSLTVTFDAELTIDGPPAGAFTLIRDVDGAAVAFTATPTVAGGVTAFTLNNFAGPAVDAGSLADGGYTLTALASKLSSGGLALDGNGDGTGGDDFRLTAAQSLFRIYGDGTGDRHVDAADVPLFTAALNTSSTAFDADGNGVVDLLDLARFREAFAATPPRVTATQVDDGTVQRSTVGSLTVTFSRQVTFAGPVTDAFTLVRDGDGAAVAFNATTAVVGGVTVVTLGGFAGAATDGGSLADGTYTLTARAGRISASGLALDGNGDGTVGDDYTFAAAQGLHRLFGDGNGDRHVDLLDLELLRQTLNRTAGDTQFLAGFDWDANGVVDLIDLGRFRDRFGRSV